MSISSHLENVRFRIASAEKKYGRATGQAALLAVSKDCPVSAVREAFEAGQRQFGENYLQEAIAKIMSLQDLPIEWHYIGALQSNKIKKIAEHFTWVQSVDSLDAAKRLSACRPTSLPPLQICIEVNQSEDLKKRGVNSCQLLELVNPVMELPRLRLRGMMAIPKASLDFEEQRRTFGQLRLLWDSVKPVCPWDVLSMGMSNDLEAAVAEGSTMVRIGTAIFGERVGHV